MKFSDQKKLLIVTRGIKLVGFTSFIAMNVFLLYSYINSNEQGRKRGEELEKMKTNKKKQQSRYIENLCCLNNVNLNILRNKSANIGKSQIKKINEQNNYDQNVIININNKTIDYIKLYLHNYKQDLSKTMKKQRSIGFIRNLANHNLFHKKKSNNGFAKSKQQSQIPEQQMPYNKSRQDFSPFDFQSLNQSLFEKQSKFKRNKNRNKPVNQQIIFSTLNIQHNKNNPEINIISNQSLYKQKRKSNISDRNQQVIIKTNEFQEKIEQNNKFQKYNREDNKKDITDNKLIKRKGGLAYDINVKQFLGKLQEPLKIQKLINLDNKFNKRAQIIQRRQKSKAYDRRNRETQIAFQLKTNKK